MTGDGDGLTVVTGAAGAIGRAICEALGASGHDVIGIDVAFTSSSGVTTHDSTGAFRPVHLDVTDEHRVLEFFSELQATPAVVVNCAGVVDRFEGIRDVSAEVWDRVLAVNLRGAFLVTRSTVGLMCDAGGGVILNVASVAGVRGGRAGAAYTVSKFGLVGLTLTTAALYGAAGIRCNALAPGGVTSDFVGGDIDERQMSRIRDRDRERPAPMSPFEVAAFAAALCGPASTAVNGAVIPVDRGWAAF